MKIEENKKQKQLLDTARDLFWKHGFKRVSIEEICLNAKVSKMTFYKFFPNKIELAKSVLEYVFDEGLEAFHKLMADDIPVSEKIKKIVLLKIDGTNNISKEFLMDFYNDTHTGLKEFIEYQTEKVMKEVLNSFKKAQKNGIFRNDFKPELIFYLAQKMSDFALDKKLAKLYDTPQDLIVDLTRFFVSGISSKE
jgi:AcrR family transcriptional regulator